MSKKVISAGHICIDITPEFINKECADVSGMFKPGKLIQTGKADIHTGGSVANTGLALRILGAEVELMGKVGNDDFGRIILERLRDYDVNDSMIIAENEETSYSVVLAVPGIDRMFLHCPGCNNTFVFEDIDIEAVKDAALFHFGYPPLMEQMYINDGAELKKMMEQIHELDIATSMDMTAIDPSTKAGIQNWDAILRNVLPYVDFFMPSAEELCYMLDKDRYESWQRRANGDDVTLYLEPETDLQPLAAKCIEYGAGVVIIKSGEPGMFYMTAGEERIRRITHRIAINPLEWASLEGFEKSYVPDKVVSGTGAGDTSIAAFIAALLNNEKPDMCLKLATATGALCVGSIDALSALVPLEDIKAKINAGWGKRE